MAILFYDASIISPMILALSLLASLGCLFGLARRRQHCRPLTPWRLPVIGNLHQLTSLPHRGLYYLSQKYGPLMLVYFGSTPYFVISSGDLAREVTKTHDYNFSNRWKTSASRLLFTGSDDLIFSPNSHFWRQARKLCVNELLSTKRVQSFYYIIEEEVAELLATIRFSCQDGGSAIELGGLFLGLANNIVCRAVLGQKCTDGGNGDGTLGELVKQANELLTAFTFGEFFPFLSWLDNLTGFNKKGIQTSQALHVFLERVIDEHEIHPAASHADRKDFVQIITELQKNDMSGLQFTRDNIKAILLVNLCRLIMERLLVPRSKSFAFHIQDMFLAGTDTSASSMEWTMAELAKHPTIMKRVQDEVRSIVGEEHKITEHHINRMEYLHCVVKESLRLHAPFIIGRQTFTDLTIGGFKIPANSNVLINSWTIHREPLIWDRPLEFLPERFLDRSSDYKGQDHNYIPFGQGRRSCPGAHFAVSEIEYALANLLFWFNWELPEGMAAEELDMSETVAQVSHKKLPLRLVPVPKAV